MKASDLRKGNYVTNEPLDIFKTGFVIVEARNIYELAVHESGQESEYYSKHFKPIQLTEEWLLNFGFKEGRKMIKHPDVFIQFSEKRRGVYFITIEIEGNERHFVKDIQHVHQLQNLYHALTGEELTLKRPEFPENRITSN